MTDPGIPAAHAAPAPEIAFEEFQRIYGPIRAMSIAEVRTLFDGAPFRWWVAGGWSVELGNTPRRLHEDVEVAVPMRDVASLRNWLREYHLWDTSAEGIHHLAPDAEFPADREQIWVRKDAYSPWVLDLMLTPVTGDSWIYKRDSRVTRPLDQVVRLGVNGVPYQRPEVTLLFKCRRLWPKDEADFAAVLPMLAAADRVWLRDAIALTEPPGHPWIDQLG